MLLFDVIPSEFSNIALGQSSTSHFEEKKKNTA
jgi:hypothetical protein